jgi:hypothetical protein
MSRHRHRSFPRIHLSAIVTLLTFGLSLFLYILANQVWRSPLFWHRHPGTKSIRFVEQTLDLRYPIQLTALDQFAGTFCAVFSDNEGDSLVWFWDNPLKHARRGTLRVATQFSGTVEAVPVAKGSDQERALILLMDFNRTSTWSKSQRFRNWASPPSPLNSPGADGRFSHMSLEEVRSRLEFVAWNLSGAKNPDVRAGWILIVTSCLLAHVVAIWIALQAGKRFNVVRRVVWLELGGLTLAALIVALPLAILVSPWKPDGEWRDRTAFLIFSVGIVFLMFHASFGMSIGYAAAKGASRASHDSAAARKGGSGKV